MYYEFLCLKTLCPGDELCVKVMSQCQYYALVWFSFLCNGEFGTSYFCLLRHILLLLHIIKLSLCRPLQRYFLLMIK